MCSGAQASLVLLHVATDGVVRRGAVLAGVLVSETRPGEVVSDFDRSYPGGADGESSGGVEVTYERLNAWDIVCTEEFE